MRDNSDESFFFRQRYLNHRDSIMIVVTISHSTNHLIFIVLKLNSIKCTIKVCLVDCSFLNIINLLNLVTMVILVIQVSSLTLKKSEIEEWGICISSSWLNKIYWVFIGRDFRPNIILYIRHLRFRRSHILRQMILHFWWLWSDEIFSFFLLATTNYFAIFPFTFWKHDIPQAFMQYIIDILRRLIFKSFDFLLFFLNFGQFMHQRFYIHFMLFFKLFFHLQVNVIRVLVQ